jgi:hypothetical protein
MHSLSISRAWDEAKGIFARDGRLFVAVALALAVLPALILGLAVPSPEAQGEGTMAPVLQIVVSLIGVVAQVALIRLALGPATTVGGAIAHGARRFPATLGALLLMIIAMALIAAPILLASTAAGIIESPSATAAPTAAGGAVILLILLLVFALVVKFMLIVPVASAERAGPITIIKRSWRLSNGHYWRLLGLMLLFLLALVLLVLTATAIGGILARVISPDLEPFSLGALVLALFTSLAQGAFTILTSLMIARVYVQLAGASEAEATVPSSGT